MGKSVCWSYSSTPVLLAALLGRAQLPVAAETLGLGDINSCKLWEPCKNELKMVPDVFTV